MTSNQSLYDCIIIGAGPGGLQAAIHLGRYNRRVLLIDRGGGRTTHANHMVNYLGLKEISGQELIATGLKQVREFGTEVRNDTAIKVSKHDCFSVQTLQGIFQGRFILASAGAIDAQPSVKGLGRFFCKGFYSCVDCDGHHTTNTKLLVMGNSVNAVRLVFGMKQMYTKEISLLLTDYSLPLDLHEELLEEEIPVSFGEPKVLLGESRLEGVKLVDGRTILCETIMATYGWRLNDTFLEGLSLDRDSEKFKILTSNTNESSLRGLYVVGAMRPGHSQAIIAAGQGAVAAIDINQRLLEL